jgi:uncharacterized protein
MTKYARSGWTAIAVVLGVAWFATEQGSAQQAPAAAQQATADPCAPAAAGRGGRGNAPARKRILAWADSRNGRAQHEYVSYALAQLQRIGKESGAYTVIIRTDSDIISFKPTMTDGKTPASGGPNLCNIDAIIYAGHREVTLSEAQKRDLISAVKDRGVGFVTLFIGILPAPNFPELGNIMGTGTSASDVHDPFGGGSTFINERPDSPFTKHLPKVWDLANGAVYHPANYDRATIDVLMRKDLTKLSPVADYTRTDGDYPVTWTRMYGKGKVFVSTIGNSEALWDNADLLKMYDEAIKWSVGMTQYEVRPHPISADARPPQGPPAPATNGRVGRGGRAGGGAAQ